MDKFSGRRRCPKAVCLLKVIVGQRQKRSKYRGYLKSSPTRHFLDTRGKQDRTPSKNSLEYYVLHYCAQLMRPWGKSRDSHHHPRGTGACYPLSLHFRIGLQKYTPLLEYIRDCQQSRIFCQECLQKKTKHSLKNRNASDSDTFSSGTRTFCCHIFFNRRQKLVSPLFILLLHQYTRQQLLNKTKQYSSTSLKLQGRRREGCAAMIFVPLSIAPDTEGVPTERWPGNPRSVYHRRHRPYTAAPQRTPPSVRPSCQTPDGAKSSRLVQNHHQDLLSLTKHTQLSHCLPSSKPL